MPSNTRGGRPLRAVVVCDAARSGNSRPGYELRAQGLQEWAGSHGLAPRLDLTTSGGRWRRIWAAALRVLRRPRADLVVVCALGGPHMVLLGWLWSLRGAGVVIDVCDAPPRRTPGGIKHNVMRLLLRAVSGPHVVLSVISPAELQRLETRGSARTIVIPPAVPRDVADLADYSGPAERVVVPADLSSPHNQAGMAMLLRALERDPAALSVPIHIYGPAEPAVELPPNVEYRGWAPDLKDVYRGDTVVFAPNLEIGGVQNKAWEAIWAGRPVVIGADAAAPLATSPWIYPFQGLDDLLPTLVTVVRAVFPPGRPRGMESNATAAPGELTRPSS